MIIKLTDFEAVQSLVGGVLSQSADGIIHYHSGQAPPSAEDIDTELKRLQAAQDALAYARARKPLYPEIGDQLDDLFKQGAFSADMEAKIKKVKDDNPKG